MKRVSTQYSKELPALGRDTVCLKRAGRPKSRWLNLSTGIPRLFSTQNRCSLNTARLARALGQKRISWPSCRPKESRICSWF